ncbi:hypothetical protein M8J77_006025 [Diaphorina citri]|nr:hypothetical protein M8J77_006025 [Diaphorina citri]
MRTVLRYSFTTLHRIGFINMKDYDCERKNKLHGIYVMIQHCILLSVICAHFLSMVTRAKRYLPELLQVVIEHTIAVSFYVVVFYANLKVPTLHVIQDYADNIFSKADMKIVRKWNRRGKMAYFIIFVLCVGVVIANILEAIIPLSEKEVEIRRKVYQNSHPEKRHPLTVWLIFFDESVGWNYIAIFIWQLYYFVFLTFIGVGIMSTVPICTFELEGQYEMLCQDLLLLGKRSVEEDMKIGKNTSENKRLGAIVSRISVRDEAQRREKIKERHERQLLRHIVKTHHTLLDFQDKLTELLAPAIIALVLCTNITFSLCLYQLFINLEEHSGIRFYKTFMLCIGAYMQFYLFCNCAERYEEFSRMVCRSITNCDWYKCTNETRRGILLILKRTQVTNYPAYYKGAFILNRLYALSVAKLGYSFVNFMKLRTKMQ